MQLVDTHQHLIWRGKLGYAWKAGIPALANGDFTPETYQAETHDLGIAGTLFMETGVDDADYRNETRLVARLVGQHGILGQIAGCRPEENEGFETWLDECAGMGVKGFRRILHTMPDELSRNETFRTNLKKIGRQGLPFDLCFLARQLPVAEELLRACPEQVFVLDHCGVPDIAGGAFDSWAKAMTRLSQFPNLNVKLSGISAYCAAGDASFRTLRPWVDHVIACFRPGRIVWGSDWPVVLLGCGLRNWIELTRKLLSNLSAEEQAAIGHLNARRIYKFS